MIKLRPRKKLFAYHMDQNKPLLHLVTVLLFLSCLVSAGSRVLKGEAAVEAQQQRNMNGKMPIKQGGFMEKMMHFESMDYPGSGANTRHDPRSPGKP